MMSPALDRDRLPYGHAMGPAPPRSSNWNEAEVKAVVATFKDDRVNGPDEDFYNQTRRRGVYFKAVATLSSMGYVRTREQIKNKLKQMKCKYRSMVSQRNPPAIPSLCGDWEYFDDMHVIMKGCMGYMDQSVGSSSTTVAQFQRNSGAITRSCQVQRVTRAHNHNDALHGNEALEDNANTPIPLAITQSESNDNIPTSPSGTRAVPDFPDVPESVDDNSDDDSDTDEEDAGHSRNDMEDLFGSNHLHNANIHMEGEMSDEATNNDGSKQNKRYARKAKANRPAKVNHSLPDHLSVAQSITEAAGRLIDHQQYHLTEQTKILQRYLKFERARMRWEMDMETRRMKWEEERELREEERYQRQEETEEKRVHDNKDFMLQLAVMLGTGSHALGSPGNLAPDEHGPNNQAKDEQFPQKQENT